MKHTETTEPVDLDRRHGGVADLEPVNGKHTGAEPIPDNGTPPHPRPPDPYADADGPTGPADPEAEAAAASWAGPDGPEPTAYDLGPIIPPGPAFFEGALARRLWLAYESVVRDVGYRTMEQRFASDKTPARWLLVARSVFAAHEITIDDAFAKRFSE